MAGAKANINNKACSLVPSLRAVTKAGHRVKAVRRSNPDNKSWLQIFDYNNNFSTTGLLRRYAALQIRPLDTARNGGNPTLMFL